MRGQHAQALHVRHSDVRWHKGSIYGTIVAQWRSALPHHGARMLPWGKDEVSCDCDKTVSLPQCRYWGLRALVKKCWPWCEDWIKLVMIVTAYWGENACHSALIILVLIKKGENCKKLFQGKVGTNDNAPTKFLSSNKGPFIKYAVLQMHWSRADRPGEILFEEKVV